MNKQRNSVLYYIFLLFLVAATAITTLSFSRTYNSSTNYTDLTDSWERATDNISSGSVVYRLSLPDTWGNEIALRTGHTTFTLLMDRKEIYVEGKPDSFYGKIPPAGWRFIPLSEPDGNTLEIVVEGGVDTPCPALETYYGGGREIAMSLIGRDIPCAVICAALILGGILVIVLHAIFHNVITRHCSMKYLGFTSLVSGIALLLSCDSASVCAPGSFFPQLMSGIIGIIAIMPFCLFVESIMSPGGGRIFVRIVSSLYCVFAAGVIIMQIARIKYLYEIKYLIFAVNIFVYICMACGVLSCCRAGNKDHTGNRFLLMAMVLLVALFGVDAAFTRCEGTMIFTALGMFILLSVCASHDVREVADMLQIANKTKVIGKMAYTDALTGLGNATAFKKRMDSLELTKVNYDSIGIVQLDINYLKTINDTLGHSVGDDLIKVGANVIKEAFGHLGDVYRIGGDEFAVIVTCERAQARCSEAAARFESILDQYNSNPNARFRLRIAYGMSFYRHDYGSRDLFLRDIQKQADELMYNKKREMKEQDTRNDMATAGKKGNDGDDNGSKNNTIVLM